jgi:hypothetical protein
MRQVDFHSQAGKLRDIPRRKADPSVAMQGQSTPWHNPHGRFNMDGQDRQDGIVLFLNYPVLHYIHVHFLKKEWGLSRMALKIHALSSFVPQGGTTA